MVRGRGGGSFPGTVVRGPHVVSGDHPGTAICGPHVVSARITSRFNGQIYPVFLHGQGLFVPGVVSIGRLE